MPPEDEEGQEVQQELNMWRHDERRGVSDKTGGRVTSCLDVTW